MKNELDFSIITPSYNMLGYLKRCCASVADQNGVNLEHIVIDGGSTDGTVDWLNQNNKVTGISEKDNGMYDAINKGLKLSKGGILAYLNCDEQYLPDILKKVKIYFENHPDVDVVFADTIIVDANGEYICHRKILKPQKYHILISHLTTFSCSTFFRRKVVDEYGIYFNTKWRDVGDAIFVLELINKKLPMGIMKILSSSFTDTGENMNLMPNAIRETKEMFCSAPFWARKGKTLIVFLHRIRRLLSGIYNQKPFRYSIYISDSLSTRKHIQVDKPTVLWRARLYKS